MDRTPPPLSVAAALATPLPEGVRGVEVLRDGDLWVRFVPHPPSRQQEKDTRHEL